MTPELIVELTDDGYVALGDKQELAAQKARAAIHAVLVAQPDGLSGNAVFKAIPKGQGGRRADIFATLQKGVEAGWWLGYQFAGRGGGLRYSPATGTGTPPKGVGTGYQLPGKPVPNARYQSVPGTTSAEDEAFMDANFPEESASK